MPFRIIYIYIYIYITDLNMYLIIEKNGDIPSVASKTMMIDDYAEER